MEEFFRLYSQELAKSEIFAEEGATSAADPKNCEVSPKFGVANPDLLSDGRPMDLEPPILFDRRRFIKTTAAAGFITSFGGVMPAFAQAGRSSELSGTDFDITITEEIRLSLPASTCFRDLWEEFEAGARA